MIDQVRPADLAAWFAQDAGAAPVLLDVREPWELQTASVAPQGFTLVAIPMNEIPGRLAELGEGKWDVLQPWDTVAPRLLNFPAPSRFNF